MSIKSDLLEQIHFKGYALIRGYCPNKASEDAFRKLGDLEKVEGMGLLQMLVPRHLHEALPNTYSGNFGKQEFPLHSDLAHWANPPRYIGLRCKVGNENVSTKLIHSEQVLANFDLADLQRTLVQPRRPMQGKKQLLRLVDSEASGAWCRFRWDSLYIRPVSQKSILTYNQVSAFLASALQLQITLLEPGDTLIIDNWICLHGRSAANNFYRHIDRAYFKSINS